MTVFEALSMVFSYAKIVPKLTNLSTLSHVKPIYEQQSTTKLNSFLKQTEAYDPQGYRTRIVSNVSNLIAGDEKNRSYRTSRWLDYSKKFKWWTYYSR